MSSFPKRLLASHRLLAIALAANLALPTAATAGTVALTTVPLASSTTSNVKPNVTFLLDDSGSMEWDHMPDDSSDPGSSVTFVYGYYGYRSSQCNQVFYDPTIDYKPPIKADKSLSYSNSSFTGAWTNGFNTSAGTKNLNSEFRAPEDGTDTTAYYHTYSGSQSTAIQKNYHSTTSTFYNECHSAQNASPGQEVFTKVVLNSAAGTTTAKLTLSCPTCTSTSVSSIKINGVEIMSGASTASTSTSTAATNIASKITLNGHSATAASNVVTITGLSDSASTIVVTRTSGDMSFSPTLYPKADATKLQNFANWYSYYRTRMLMMKTAAGHAFKNLDNKYRVGLMKISTSTPVVYVGTFEGTADTDQRGKWYKALYDMGTSGSTPLRTALSNAGRYYAGKLTGTDPVEYSCQQNFTIMSTDGYWNSGDPIDINGNAFSADDNQDATAARPMYDGAIVSGTTTVTITYTRNDFSCTSSIPGPDCSSGKKQLKTQPQIGSCTVVVAGTPTGTESCAPGSWSNTGTTSYSGICTSSCTTPSPDPSTKVEFGRVESADSSGGSKTRNSLADIAMYYYQTDLRTSDIGNCSNGVNSENVCTNNVFTSSSDNNIKQHMTTFTLGMGASGRMNYASCYLSDTCANNEDFRAVKLGSTANSAPPSGPPICSWQANGTVCNWPIPGMTGSDGLISNIDDLWHAAVNGRGAYFAATNPTSLAAGLSNALSALNARQGSAAAAATSTLNPVAGNNFAYVASYTTVTWKGNLEARGINTDTGEVNENASWCVENVVAGSCAAPGTIIPETSGDVTVYYCATPDSVICPDGILDGGVCKVQMATACTGTMNSKVADTTDTRLIYTSDGSALTPFNAAYATAHPSYFSEAYLNTRSPALSQWSSLTAAQKTAASGVNLLNYLRGQYGYEDRASNLEDNRLYRYREAVLGDALESQPAFIAKPVFEYPYPGYDAYRTAQAARAGTVYMGANDGMMHAFASDTGIERWAYIPSMLIPNLWKLADKNYSIGHTNYVNGSPITSDVCVANCADALTAVWKTIMVAGLNGGGRGYFALDITNPTTPVLLWEFTTIAGIGAVKDDDLGYSFGHPIITRKADGTWVVLVTSGYNNTGPGDGKGYLYVLNATTGAIISKIGTGVGSSATPSGLAKVSGWNYEAKGNRVSYVYGGDLEGNVWRFDINDPAVAAIGTGKVMKFALLKDLSGNVQPITTAPTLGRAANKRVIFIGTGKYLETGDLTNGQKQSLYAITDDDVTTTLVNPRTSPIMKVQTITAAVDTPTRTVSNNPVDLHSDRGWYVDFPDSGERVNIDMRLVSGVLLVATTVPTNTACDPGGTGWLNFFNYATGSATGEDNVVSTKTDGPIVGINVLYIDGEPKVEIVTSEKPTPEIPPIQPTFDATAGGFQGKRVIWRELMQ